MRKRSDKLNSENARELRVKMDKIRILSDFTFPSKPSSDGYFHIYVPDATKKSGRRAIKAKTLKALEEKVYRIIKDENSFKIIFERMCENRLKYIKSDEKIASAKNTVKLHKSYYKRYFAGTFFEEMAVDSILKEDIEDICLYNLKRYDLRGQAFNNLKTIINQTFKYAYENYICLDNPNSHVDYRKFEHMLSSDVPIRYRMYSEDDVDRIIDFLHDLQVSKPHYIPSYAFELQILMGLRCGEVPPLTWNDVSDDAILICKEMIRTAKNEYGESVMIVHHTKTYKDRYFPITSDISNLLDRLSYVHDRFNLNSPYLFPGKRNHYGCIGYRTIYTLYLKVAKELGLQVSRDFIKGTHSFRRNAITKTANNSGGDIFLASQLYGNSPRIAEANYYKGIDMASARRVLEIG